MARLSPEDQKELREQVRREEALEKETPDQKWVRSTIREEIKSILTDFFAESEESDPKPKDGGPGAFLKNVLGQTGS